MSSYTNLTDSELLRRVSVMPALSSLEAELAARLERALEEVDALDARVSEVASGNDAGRPSEGRREAVVAVQGNLVLFPRQ